MSRLKLWGMLLVSSIVSLVSLLSVLDDRNGDQGWEREEKWIVSVICISIILSFLGTLASFFPPERSMKMEMPLIVITLGFWAAGMPALFDPDKELAVGPNFAISNANLFVFGWGAMVSCICLGADYAREYNGDNDSPVALKWILLAACSLILMGTSASISSEVNCGSVRDTEEFESFCRRTSFGVWFGLCSAALSLLVAPIKRAPYACHALLSLLVMFPSWCCAVAYLTFGSGPGTNLGNIYFASWIGFFLTFNLVTTSVRYAYEDMHTKKEEPEKASSAAPSDKGEEKKEEDVEG